MQKNSLFLLFKMSN